MELTPRTRLPLRDAVVLIVDDVSANVQARRPSREAGNVIPRPARPRRRRLESADANLSC